MSKWITSINTISICSSKKIKKRIFIINIIKKKNLCRSDSNNDGNFAYAEFNRLSIRVSACVNGTRLVWIDGWFDDGNKYRSVWWSDNWPIIPVFDDKSFKLLFDKNDDVEIPLFVVEKFENVLLSSDECPSNEPLVINDVGGFIKRSLLSDIVRESNGDCWELIIGSREVGGDNSRGMFEVGKVDPGPEYKDDGIVVPLANVNVDDVVDDGALIWEILLRICWFNWPEKADIFMEIIRKKIQLNIVLTSMARTLNFLLSSVNKMSVKIRDTYWWSSMN